MLASIEGVLLACAPGEHTTAAHVRSKAAGVDHLVSIALSAILKAWFDGAECADALGAVEPLLIAKRALEWMSDIVQLAERTPQETSPLERQAARAVSSIERSRQMLWLEENSEMSGAFTQAQVGACELLVLCCGRALEIEELRGKGMGKLTLRLCAACGFMVDQSAKFWSKLGKAKYHVYTPGKTWSGAKKRLLKREGEAAQAAADSAARAAADSAGRADTTEQHHVEVAVAISLADLL